MTANIETKLIDEVKVSFRKASMVVVIIIGLSWWAASLINSNYPLRDSTIHFIQLLSFIPGTVGFFGIQPWEKPTWRRDSPHELLSKKIQNRFALIGVFLYAFSASLKPVNDDQKWKSDMEEKVKQLEGLYFSHEKAINGKYE